MKALYLIIFALMVSQGIFAHGTETHGESKTESKQKQSADSVNDQGHMSEMSNTQDMTEMSQMHIDQINQAYQKYVKVIFEKKCFDCHGIASQFPWYYNIPGIKQLMDKDVRDAKEHVDMSNDFPFSGHGDPISDLRSVKKSIEEDTMPIFMYRLTHPDAKLTEAERIIVFRWIDEAIKKLGSSQ